MQGSKSTYIYKLLYKRVEQWDNTNEIFPLTLQNSSMIIESILTLQLEWRHNKFKIQDGLSSYIQICLLQ